MDDPSPVDSPREPYPGYRLEAKGREAAEDERLNLLEQVFDPGSRQRRELVRPGWRCLEVGAGRGSMAAWLAEQVGPDGQVVAIDINVDYLARLDVPNLVVRRHDILNDPVDDLDPGSFDLVCSRLMLFWLAGRQEEAVQHMVQCLRPGGWLIDEDGDWGAAGPVDPAHPRYAGYDRVYQHGGWFCRSRLRPVLRAKAGATVRSLRPARHPARRQRQGGARSQPVGEVVGGHAGRHPRLGDGRRDPTWVGRAGAPGAHRRVPGSLGVADVRVAACLPRPAPS
jgi:SAM-dependent methyltransferase